MWDYTYLGWDPFYSPFGWGFYPFGGFYGGYYGGGFYGYGGRGFHGGRGFGGGWLWRRWIPRWWRWWAAVRRPRIAYLKRSE